MNYNIYKSFRLILAIIIIITFNIQKSHAQYWQVAGNAATTGNVLGTTNAQPLILTTNGVQRAIILSSGNVGIGTTTPSYTLDVTGTGHFTGALLIGGLTIGTYSLPSTDGTNGYYLSTNGSGVVSWTKPAVPSWGITGTSGTTVGIDYIGTSDAEPLEIKVNGIKAGYLDYAGGGNTSYGCTALNNITGGDNNTAIGFDALAGNTNASSNTAIGYGALYSQAYNTGSSTYFANNVAVGYESLYSSNPTSTTNGINNAGTGSYSLFSNTTGTGNTANGYYALYYNTTGTQNTAIGEMSLESNTIGSYNTAIGYNADVATNNLTNATAVGYNAKVSTSNTMLLGNTSVTQHEFSGALMPYYNSTYNAGTIGQVLESFGPNVAPQWVTQVNPVGWNVTGNSGTVVGTDFIGTTDAQPLEFKVDNQKAGYIDYAGNENTSFGYTALNSVVTGGDNNTAIGYGALKSNTNAASSTAVGFGALYNQAYAYTGTYFVNNVAIGFESLYNNNPTTSTNGINNVGAGSYALFTNTTGTNNTAIGNYALCYNTMGNSNTAIGETALKTNTTGNDNTAVGFGADVSVNNLTNATAIGFNTKVTTSNTVLLGNSSVTQFEFNGALKPYYSNAYNAGTTGQILESFGPNVAPEWVTTPTAWNVTGNSGTTVGTDYIGTSDAQPLEFKVNGLKAGYIDYAGSYNTSFGCTALNNVNGGDNNTALGFGALATNTNASSSTAIGYGALYSQAFNSGSSTYFANNVAIGYESLYNTNPTSTTTGINNAALGAYSLFTNSTGVANSAHGYYSLYANTTGSDNTAIGYGSLQTNTVGSNNTAIGYDADVSTNSLSNATAIGNTAKVTASNEVVIGNSAITNVGSYAGWFTISDGRFKKDIQDNVVGLAFIKKLKPVTYHLNMEKLNESIYGDKAADYSKDMADAIATKEKILYSGFVAQDVEQTAKSVGYNFSGVMAPQNDNDHYSISYSDFVVPLVKAVQELSIQNDSLKNVAEQQQEVNSQLQNAVAVQQQQINDLKNQMQQFENALSQCCTSYQAPGGSGSVNSVSNQSGTNSNGPHLDQNMPNPFSQNTIIKCYLPENTQNAMIKIFTVNGAVLQTYNVPGTGVQQITISGSTLSAGNYYYSLIIDGNRLDTKEMILTK